jgi:hypothetical protein
MSFYYGNSEFPSSLMVDKHFNNVKLKDFFSVQKVLIFKKDEPFYLNFTKSSSEAFRELKVADDQDFDVVIWENGYLMPFLYKSLFHIVGYFAYEEPVPSTDESEFQGDEDYYNKIVYQAVLYERSTEYRPVACNSLGNKIILSKLKMSKSGVRKRNSILPLEKYYKTLSVNSKSNDFYTSFAGLNHYIISPFNDLDSLFEIKRKIEEIDSHDNSAILSLIKEKFLRKLVTDTLVDFIIKNSVFEKAKSEDIYEAYANLIKDYLEIENVPLGIDIGTY